MPQNALSIAPRYQQPPNFGGTAVKWRALCELYPAAESPDAIIAVLDYCAARSLDPYRKPVHIVPMYNSRLHRKVQVVMQGINEIETTAARSKLWAGISEPKWGEEVEKTFRGQYEEDNGTVKQVAVTLAFPVSCGLIAYKLVGGSPRAFYAEAWWMECYGRSGFRSEVPNARWQQAPRQMLHKVTKAAVLRMTFPEDVGGQYAAEEMEGRDIEHGGLTIDGTVATPDAPEAPPAAEVQTPLDHQADAAYGTESRPGGDGDGDFRIATPTGGYAFTDVISWLAQWDRLINELADKPNDIRALRALNTGAFQAVADLNLAAEMEIQGKLDRLLQRRGNR